MKRTLALVLLLLSVSVGFAFAQRRPADRFIPRDETVEPVSRELVELTGVLQIDEWDRIELRADGRQYILMHSPRIVAELELRSGQTVTVSGYELPPPRFAPSEEYRVLAPVTIRTEERTFELSRYRGTRSAEWYHRRDRHHDRYGRSSRETDRYRPGVRRR